MLACLKAFFVSRFFLVSVVVDSFLLRICGFESLRNSVCGLLFPGAGLLHSGCVVSPLFFLLSLVCALLSYNRDRFLSCWDAFFGVLLRFSLYIVRRPSWYLSPSGVLRPRGARCFRSLFPRGAASLRSLVLRVSSNPGFCFSFAFTSVCGDPSLPLVIQETARDRLSAYCCSVFRIHFWGIWLAKLVVLHVLPHYGGGNVRWPRDTFLRSVVQAWNSDLAIWRICQPLVWRF